MGVNLSVRKTISVTPSKLCIVSTRADVHLHCSKEFFPHTRDKNNEQTILKFRLHVSTRIYETFTFSRNRLVFAILFFPNKNKNHCIL